MDELFDPQCQELAEHFLQHEVADVGRVKSLAIAIQQAVEDWYLDNAQTPSEAP